jgi:chromosome segregation ATPase
MALSAESRSVLYTSLTDLVPDPKAVTEMLDHFPSREIDEPTTRDHVSAEISLVRADISRVQGEMHAQLAETRSDIATLDQRVTALDQRVTIGLAALGDKIDQQGSRLDQRIDEQGVQLGQRLDEQSTSLGQRLDDHVKHLDRQAAMIAALGEALATTQKELSAEMRRWFLTFIMVAIAIVSLARLTP